MIKKLNSSKRDKNFMLLRSQNNSLLPIRFVVLTNHKNTIYHKNLKMSIRIRSRSLNSLRYMTISSVCNEIRNIKYKNA